MNRHVSCAVVGTNMFIASEDEMAKVEDFSDLLASDDDDTPRVKTAPVSFDLMVPYLLSRIRCV